MKISQFLKNIRKDQHGVAIVFTLGILGLLTVIALGFASTALLNGKLAKNVSNDAYAKSMAKNLALSQALYTIYHVNAEPWTRDFGRIYSYDTNANTNDWLWKLNTAVNGVNLFTYPVAGDTNPLRNVRWRYVRESSTDPNSRIVGRYAYVVVPDKGRLSPNIHVGRTPGPDDNTSRAQYPSQGVSFRTNRDNTNGNSSALSSQITPGSRSTFRCVTYHDMIRRLGITDASYNNWFDQFGINITPLPRSREAYMKSDGRYYERFNMNRNWDEMTVAQLMGLTSDETLVNDSVREIQFDDNTSGSSDTLNYIPLLQDMWRSASGTPALQNRYKQIAANIIQYNRSASAPTVSDPAKPLATCLDEEPTNVPAYMGIGKHPMLNEIGFYITIVPNIIYAGENGDNGYKYQSYYDITINLGLELINIFHADLSGKNYKVQFFGTLSVSVKDPKSFGPFANSDAVFKKETSFSPDTSSLIAEIDTSDLKSGYLGTDKFFRHQIKNQPSPVEFAVNGAKQNEDYFTPYMGVTKLDFNITKVVLKEADRVVGMCVLKPKPFTNSSSISKGQYFSFSYQSKNPLVNLSSDTWAFSELKSNTIKFASENSKDSLDIRDTLTMIKNYGNGTESDKAGTAGVKNSEIAEGCPGNNNDPSQLPFAFMRQGPMQSFAEFACIHSGSGWNTLDLTTKGLGTNPESDTQRYPMPPDNEEEQRVWCPPFGAIFDQVKFSSERYNYGQINVNTDSHASLFALLDYANRNTRTGLTSASNTNDIMQAGTQGDGRMALNFCLHPTYSGASSCAACAIRTATTNQNYLFRNRGDLLLNNATLTEDNLIGYSGSGTYSNLSGDLTTVFSRLSVGANQTEKNVFISQIMPLLRADPVDMAYIIIVAQTIQDQGGVPLFVDLNGDGEFSSEELSWDDKLRKKLGYRYKNLAGSETNLSNPSMPVKETYVATDTQIGRYDLGADKITGEAKLIAKVVRDGITGRWKIVEIRYVE